MTERQIDELIANAAYKIVGVMIVDDSVVFRVREFVPIQNDMPKLIGGKRVMIIKST